MNRLFSSLRVIVLVTFAALCVGCSDDASVSTSDNYTFDYQISDLIGIWETESVLDAASDTWYAVDGSVSGYSIFNFKMRFNSDYTYLLDGVVSNESGTYTTYGTLVTTYISGVQQAEYDILSLGNGSMELMLIRGTDVTTYRLVKSW